jgi:hypothetical protein
MNTSHRKYLFGGLWCSLLLTTIFVTDLRGEDHSSDCRRVLNAEGRFSSSHPTKRDQQIAKTNAIRKWEQLANELYGSAYSKWRTAKANKIECDRYRGELSGRTSCVASAQPCPSNAR